MININDVYCEFFKNYFEGKNKTFWNLIYCYFVFFLVSLSCCIVYVHFFLIKFQKFYPKLLFK